MCTLCQAAITCLNTDAHEVTYAKNRIECPVLLINADLRPHNRRSVTLLCPGSRPPPSPAIQAPRTSSTSTPGHGWAFTLKVTEGLI